MKVYIYTIPKAGTYFLADFVSRLGYNNTGYHVSQNKFLNTAKFDMDTNARFPSRSMVKQPFMKTLKTMRDGDLAFGHFPLPLMAWMFPDFFFVCAYRHPRKTLMSEFVDFRFRREDVRWLSRDEIADDRDAFVAYLDRHGEVHMSIFSQMLGITLLRQEPLCRRFQNERFHMLDFESMLKGKDGATGLAASLGIGADEALRALEATKAAETKTKATGLEIDRDALWSERAEEAYVRLNAEAYVTRGRELGWAF